MSNRKKRTERAPGLNVAAIMTISLFLILLTFFVLLNSIAVIDEKKTIMAIGSLLGAFGRFHGGLSSLTTGNFTTPPSPPIVERRVDARDLLLLLSKSLKGQIKVESSDEETTITVNEKVLFNENGARLKSSSYPTLNRLCSYINKGDYSVEIVGHTDSVPANEKGFKSNWELSTLMAMGVLHYFIERGSIRPERLTAYGYGAVRPIASNETRQSRAQNRRVDIILRSEVPPYIKRIYEKKPAGIFTYRKFNFWVFR